MLSPREVFARFLHFEGHPKNITHRLFWDIVRAHRHGLIVTATTDGTHSSGSYHYPRNNADGLGHAVDFGNKVPGTAAARRRMIRFQRAEGAKGSSKYRELFGPDNWYVKDGVRHSGAFPGHQDHVHVAK